jgi:enhancing lycopene biosynthesis protein 2
MKKFAIILSGSGVYDGAEIHEATLAMLAIMQHGGSYQCFAPDIDQYHVVNHLSGQEMAEKRNVLVESARIARGNILDLAEFNPGEFDALLMPGGFGVAKNLCDFAFKGAECEVQPDVAKAIRLMHKSGKPIGAMCISPVVVSRLLGDVMITLGQDQATIENVEKMGSRHVATTHGEVIVDEKNNIFTTPCYMLDANILQIYDGATHIIKSILEHLK